MLYRMDGSKGTPWELLALKKSQELIRDPAVGDWVTGCLVPPHPQSAGPLWGGPGQWRVQSRPWDCPVGEALTWPPCCL